MPVLPEMREMVEAQETAEVLAVEGAPEMGED